MFIKDGQLPEDLAAKRKAGITENSPQPEIADEEKIYEKENRIGTECGVADHRTLRL